LAESTRTLNIFPEEFGHVDAAIAANLTIVDPPAWFFELLNNFRSLLRRDIDAKWLTQSVATDMRNTHP
jgi:hypothetical protein